MTLSMSVTTVIEPMPTCIQSHDRFLQGLSTQDLEPFALH